MTETAFEMYLDCDTSSGAIEAPPCVFPTGTTTVDIGIVLKNDSGAGVKLAAMNFTTVTNQQTVMNPTAPVCSGAGLDCNPDFNQAAITGSWNCSAPLPRADFNPDANIAQSDISCFNGSGDGPILADGATIMLGTVHYISVDGAGSFSLAAVSVYDDSFSEIMSCNPVILNAGVCFDAAIQIGNVAATPTTVPIPVGADCPEARETRRIVLHVTEDGGPVRRDFGCFSVVASVEEIVTSDPSGLYRKPLDPPEALARFPRPPVNVAPDASPGLLDGLLGPSTNQVGVPGVNLCHASQEIEQFGAPIYSYDVYTYFNIAPLSNLTDWSFTQDAHVTPWGFVQRWSTQSADGLLIPMAYYSPGIVSVLWQSGTGVFVFPVPGVPPTVRETLRLSEFINSPGVVPDVLCDEEWTLDTETVIDPPLDWIKRGGEWCFNHWWWCIGPIGLGPFF